jgi:hypothetical protein
MNKQFNKKRKSRGSQGEWGVIAHRVQDLVWDEKIVLEMDRGDGCTTL